MPRSAAQLEGNEFQEIRNIQSGEEWYAYDQEGVAHPAIWERIFLHVPEDIRNAVRGLQDHTRDQIVARLGPNVVQLFREEKGRAKIQESAYEEEQRVATAQGWGNWGKTMINFRRKFFDKLRPTHTHAEQEYFEGADLPAKRANLEAQITAIGGVTMMTPGGVAVPIVFNNIPVILPGLAGSPAAAVNWINMPMWRIREQLQSTGQYNHIAPQAGWGQFEVLKRRIDRLTEIEVEVNEENISGSMFDFQRLRQAWNENHHGVRALLEPILDNTHDFKDPYVRYIIAVLQGDNEFGVANPDEAARLQNIRNRMMELLGQGNQRLINQQQIVSDLGKTITNLEKLNDTRIGELFRDIPQTARNVINYNDPTNLDPDPAAPPPPPLTRFASVQAQIDAYQLRINQWQHDLTNPLITAAQRQALNDNIREDVRKLENSKVLQTKISEAEEKLRNFCGELLDSFNVSFRNALTQSPPAPPLINPAAPGNPFRAGTNLHALYNAHDAAMGGGPTTALAGLLTGGGFWDNLQHEIGNTRGGLPDNENFLRRMAIYIEQQKTEKKQQQGLLTKIEEAQQETSKTQYSAKEIAIAYAKAKIESRGIINEATRDAEAVMLIEKARLEIEKADNFMPYINEELGQTLARNVFGRLWNRLNFMTWHQDDILRELSNYSRLHRKILKHVTTESSFEEILQVMDKEEISFSELPVIWKTLYEILKTKKIRGAGDEQIEIQDSAWRPLQLFIERVQKAYLMKKAENFVELLDKNENENIRSKHTDDARFIAALEEQDKAITESEKTFREDVDNLLKWLKGRGKNAYDWVFGRYRRQELTDLRKKIKEGTATEEEKNFLQNFGIDIEKLKAGDLTAIAGAALMAKEASDIFNKYLGGGLNIGSKSIAALSTAGNATKNGMRYVWEHTTGAVKGGINVAGKIARGTIATLLLPAYPVLHPAKTAKGLGKAGKFVAWTVPKEVIKSPYYLVRGLRKIV